jgi:hypothetical protein
VLLKSCLFLVVMNWFDGIVIDWLKYLYGYVFDSRFDSGRHYRSNWKTVKILNLGR